MLNLYWEKTPENVFYDAVTSAVTELTPCVLVDYTTTENSYLRLMIGAA